MVSDQSLYLFVFLHPLNIMSYNKHLFLKGDDEDDAEDENNSGRTNSDGPSAKRPKPAS
jgi:hypothetical protein